jgi:hypothetical protein
MIKLGIAHLRQLEKIRFDNTIESNKLISVTLYDKVGGLTYPNLVAERILLTFADERGAYKRTYKSRFDDFDHLVLDVLRNVGMIESIHDIGVSDGRTALEFFIKVSRIFPEAKYLATDYRAALVVLESGSLKVTVNESGLIYEITRFPFVFNRIKKDSIIRYPLNRLIAFLLEKLYAKNMIAKYLSGLDGGTELLLFSPEALEMEAKDMRFRLASYDVLKPMSGAYNVVRVMNLLNPSYFSEYEIMQAVSNVFSGLKNNGLFITGSNQGAGSQVNGGVYQKIGRSFIPLLRVGSGSPFDTIILGVR